MKNGNLVFHNLEDLAVINPPHETCHIAYIMGIRIENSFEPEVGEMNPLFEAGNEVFYT
jgi:hypothetical protein